MPWASSLELSAHGHVAGHSLSIPERCYVPLCRIKPLEAHAMPLQQWRRLSNAASQGGGEAVDVVGDLDERVALAQGNVEVVGPRSVRAAG